MTSAKSGTWKYRFMCIVALLLWIAGPAGATENWKGQADPAFAGGSGTKGDPWKIALPEQLALLADRVNEGGSENAPYRIGWYVLTADIDLSAREWTPIGIATFSWPTFTPVSDRSFGGVFDGNGHTISGLRCASNTEVAVGLFGVLDGGWVLNLSLEADIEIPDGDGTAGRATGGIAGLLVNGIVESCDVHGSVSGGSLTWAGGPLLCSTGGIVGRSIGGHILSSTNTAAVTGTSMTGTGTNDARSYLGGIVGRSTGEISRVLNGGTVTGGTFGSTGTQNTSCTGGIAGDLGNGGEISYGVNNGPIAGPRLAGDLEMGGIAGFIGNSSIKFSINNGAVTAGDSTRQFLGGIAGAVYTGSTVSDVANTGTIKGATVSGTYDYAGGIAGFIDTTGTVRNAYNFSDVTGGKGMGPEPQIGGVAGGNAGTIASAYWNSDRTVTSGKGVVYGYDTATPLNGSSFGLASSFAGWSISATPGDPGGNVWFYPSYDPGRPHLASFFDADGQPVASVVPSTVPFVVGKDDTRYLTLFVGDEMPAIGGFGFGSNPWGVDGITPSPDAADVLRLQYANGSVAGTLGGSILYTQGGRPGYFQSPFTVTVLPLLEVGEQSRTVRQGDVLTPADPLRLPLTTVGGPGVFETPVPDPASGLTAQAAADGTAIVFTGTAGTPGGYPAEIRGTVDGLPVSVPGLVTILPSVVPPAGNITVLNLNPSVTTRDTPTAFTATASAPVAAATLRVTWPDGSSAAVSVSAAGTALAFSLTPAQTGTAVLTFTLAGTDGATSVDSVTLKIQENGGGGGDDSIGILSLTPAAATVDTPTAFAALTDSSVSGATLRVTYPDGSTQDVSVTASGKVLTFTFTPARTGTAVLTFTLTGANGTVSVDSAALTVRQQDGVRVSNLTPPEAAVGVPAFFAATTSRPVAGAVLLTTWPDGSSTAAPVTVSNGTLSFSLTPPQEGRAVLTFTLTEADGSKSTDAAGLPVRNPTPRAPLIESVTVVPAPPHRVGDDLRITVKLTRPGDVVMYVDTPRGTIETLLTTQGGETAEAHYIPDWPGTYRLIAEASDGGEIATAAVTFRVTEGRIVRHRGHGGSGCDGGPGALALLLLASAIGKGWRFAPKRS